MSWGAPENQEQLLYDKIFEAPGVSFFASAGDTPALVSWPASSRNVIAVGGTTLSLRTKTSPTIEEAWVDGGGGISAFEPAPAFQSGWVNSKFRVVPDVAYDADPVTGVSVFDSVPYPVAGQPGYEVKGWFVLGGTSAGAPQWAAAMALVNQERQSKGKDPLTSTLTALYQAAGTSPHINASNFLDILGGYEESTNALIYARPGFDLATGLGVPKMNSLIPFLAND